MNRTMKQAAGLAAGFMRRGVNRFPSIDQNAPLPGSSSAPACPPGYHLEWRSYVGPTQYNSLGVPIPQTPQQRLECVPDAHPVYAPVQSASQALTAILRQTALPTNQPSAGGRHPARPYQWGGLHGSEEDNMQSDLVSMAAGLGALFAGLGVPGPYGANPATMISAGTYEISGTGVEFRDAPSLGGAIIDTFNPDMSGGNSVVGTPDQVAFNGQTATGNGLTWANVTAKGKTGFVAVEYMAPVGWTAQQGKVVPKGGGGGGGGGGNIQPASDTSSSTTTTDYTPYILGGAAVLGGGIILWAVLAKPKKGGGKHRRRAHA